MSTAETLDETPSPFLPNTQIQYAGTEEENRASFIIDNAIVNGECWECHLVPVAKGYCYIQVGGRYGIKWRAHRLIWTVVNGEIPEGKLVLHKCDNRKCIHPDHLFLGSERDNTRDMMKKGRNKYILPNNQKLTPAQMKLVRELRNEGCSYGAIAEQFGVSASTIMNYLRREDV